LEICDLPVHAESKNRKILLVTNDLGPHTGGIESFILGLLSQLNGQEIVIYTSKEDGDSEFDAALGKKYGVEIIRDRARTLVPTPRVNRSVSRVMSEYGSQYIWFGAAAPLGFMAGHLRRKGATRIVALTHGHEVWWSRIWPFTIFMKAMALKIDAFGYLGDFTKSAMKKAVGDRTKFVRIAPGIAIDHFVPGDKSPELISQYELEGKLVIVCVARLVHRKGQDKLIEAMPEIVKSLPSAVLLIIGQGPYRAHLEKLVAKYHVQNSVRFIGRLPYEALPAHIQLGDIFAMPSRSRLLGLEVEGLGISYLEASACGIPVVGGMSGGAPDAVIENETGTIVNGRDRQAIALSIITLLQDSERRAAMAHRGREWAVSEWNWSLWGERFRQLLLGQEI
jgi:phosphatidylinositol alpha-1,6-mannosyltransferase